MSNTITLKFEHRNMPLIVALSRWAALWNRVLALLLGVAVTWAGCSSSSGTRKTESIPNPLLVDPSGELFAESSWTKEPIGIIHKGDHLFIEFAKSPGETAPITVEQWVGKNGNITLLSNRVFEASGKLRWDLEKEIQQGYLRAGFEQVSVSETSPALFKVDGEVRSPYRGIFIPPITIVQAIDLAGGFTKAADKRRLEVWHVNGPVDLLDYAKIAKDCTEVPCLLPGDIVQVKRKKFLW